MFCVNCGNQISKQDKYCTKCGCQLSQSEPKRSKYIRRFLYVISIITLIICFQPLITSLLIGLIGGFLFFGGFGAVELSGLLLWNTFIEIIKHCYIFLILSICVLVSAIVWTHKVKKVYSRKN